MKKMLLCSMLYVLFSCNNKELKINDLDLTNLNNYTITNTKVNDSITSVKGVGKENDYIIQGTFNTKHNVKTGWWDIKSELLKKEIKIEYLFIDNEVFMNQKIVYLNGKIYKPYSKYYTQKYEDDGFQIDVYFQPSEFKPYSVKLFYTIGDSVKRKQMKTGNISLVKNQDFHSCFIPLEENEFITGLVSNSSKLTKKDSVYFSVRRMYMLILNR